MNARFYKTPLRYPGGKSRAIKILKDYFPPSFSEYREPFFGGGSVGIYLAQNLLCQKQIQFLANDFNQDVYCFWDILKTQNQALINEIQSIRKYYKNGRELYENILSRRNKDLSSFQRAVDFFVLNRITFSGVVDCGGYSQKAFESRFTQSSIERLKNMDVILQNFIFSNESYENLLQKEGEDVFIFLDPPYYSTIKSRLYGKKGDLHIGFNHQKLCDNLKNTKHKFLLTYDDSEFIRELYKDFYLQEWTLQYGMNNYKQGKADKGKELLISNFEIKNSIKYFHFESLTNVNSKLTC
ncbi:DNA adenine methylase [Helicobacter turcicus]|uniref:Site-specific DNA-methyltransferase (adenine-specific) n=1 Tax=Helicobacter turcicus TaxID=2867412 RepID=A0ABS7JKV2_9HELI|nr:DNA adenine methylase [Helicobacter turcicus]MBX7490000.1 DNA adenine methylase [Helicobacter turcicus]MBX7544859.1 DNA adenine methylase [Helicobacter turcicus]